MGSLTQLFSAALISLAFVSAHAGVIANVQDPYALNPGFTGTFVETQAVPFATEGDNQIMVYKSYQWCFGDSCGGHIGITDGYLITTDPEQKPATGTVTETPPSAFPMNTYLPDAVKQRNTQKYRFKVREPACCGGVRGRLETDGVTIREGSPGYYMFSSLNEDFDLSFIVDHAAIGDYMSIYTADGMVWNQLLTDFAIGVMYTLTVPQALSIPKGSTDLTTIWLQGIGDLSSSVDFIQSARVTPEMEVPEPATGALLVIGLLSATIIRRRGPIRLIRSQ
jgi:hypothetical protein